MREPGETENFPKTHQLPIKTQEEITNMNRAIPSKKVESVTSQNRKDSSPGNYSI